MKKIALAAAMALLVAGCYTAGPDDGLGVRKLAWFSYLNADDIKPTCGPGSPERLRLVFNADYAEHVRTYDLTVDAKAGGGDLAIRVMPAGSIVDVSREGLLDPWRGTRADVRLTPAQSTELQGAIASAGAFGPPPVGLSLPSSSFYWLVTGCHQGHAFINAYPLTGNNDAALAFVPALMALDKSNAAVPDIAAHNRRLSRLPPRGSQDIALAFTIRIGETGLSGTLPP